MKKDNVLTSLEERYCYSTDAGNFISESQVADLVVFVETIEEVIASALDAKKAWLEAALEDGDTIQEPDNIDNYSGQFKLRMPKSLHKQLAEQSKKEGISMNQYCLYLLAQNNALHNA